MKRLKKLLSVVLVGAMALSLCTTALAANPLSTLSGDPAANPPASTLSGDTMTTVSGDGKVGSGQIDAQSVSQGAVPAKPISVILPVIPARAAGKAQLFDFILDPHQLITQTDAARYMSVLSGLGAANELFDPNARLYFASQTGADYPYSGSSKVLTVTNTGFVPLDVDLDLEFDRGTADFDLVSGDSLLSGGLLVRPQMYLAVVASGKTGPITKPIEDPADNAVPTVKYTTANEYLAKVGTLTQPVFEYDEDNYGTEADSTYSGDSIALDDALEQVKITLTFTPHNVGSDKESAADDGVAYLKVAVTGVPNTLASQVIDKDGNTFSVSSGGTIPTPVDDAVGESDDPVQVTVQIGTQDTQIGTQDTSATPASFGDLLAGITFAVKVSDDPAEPEGTQTLTLRKPHTGAMLETALGVLDDSYELAHTTDSTKIAELTAQGVERTDAGYYWEKTKLNDALYPAFSFHLEGNINEANRDNDAMVSPWDDIDASSNVKFNMTWDVTPYSEYAERPMLTDPVEDAAPAVADEPPTVEVTTRATATTNTSTKTATLTWTEGTGAYEEYEPVSASNSKGSFTGTAFSVTGNTIKLLANSTLKADTNCVITFSDGTDTYDVDVTGWFGTN